MDRKRNRALGRKLREEIEFWEEEGLISPIQKERVLARYSLAPKPEKEGQGGNLAPTFSILGTLLIGIGVLSLVMAYWSRIELWGKLLVMFIPMVASWGAGYYLRNARGDFPRVGAFFLLLGSVLFGATIFLSTELFHFHLNLLHGSLLWGLGMLLLAYLLRFKALLFLSLLVLLFWLGLETIPLLSEQPLVLSPFSFLNRKLICLYLMAGIALWGMGLTHRGSSRFRKISDAYIVSGMLAALIAGFLLTFDIYGERLGAVQLWLFYLVIPGIFLLSILGRWISGEQEIGWVLETLFLLIIMGLGIYFSLFFPGIPGKDHKDLTVPSNIIFALGILIILFLGYLRQYPPYIDMSVFFLVLYLGFRYYEFFWEPLPRYLFLMIGGLALLVGGALLEKARRKILDSFRKEEEGL